MNNFGSMKRAENDTIPGTISKNSLGIDLTVYSQKSIYSYPCKRVFACIIAVC